LLNVSNNKVLSGSDEKTSSVPDNETPCTLNGRRTSAGGLTRPDQEGQTVLIEEGGKKKRRRKRKKSKKKIIRDQAGAEKFHAAQRAREAEAMQGQELSNVIDGEDSSASVHRHTSIEGQIMFEHREQPTVKQEEPDTSEQENMNTVKQEPDTIKQDELDTIKQEE
jgi:hypothetical protein